MDTEGYAPDILGLSIAHPMLDAMYFPLGHKEDVNIDEETKTYMETVLKDVPYRVFHHAGHDTISLPYLFDLPFFCTMIGVHMVNENLASKSLDYVHKELCGGEGKKRPDVMQSIISTMGWEYVPYAMMYEYASWDARITMEVFLKILPEFEEQFGPLWSSDVV